MWFALSGKHAGNILIILIVGCCSAAIIELARLIFFWVIVFIIFFRDRSTNGNLYFQMFEDLLIALEHLEEQDHKRRGKL